MNYTYDDFISAADADGLTSAFSQQDLQAAQKNPEFGISLLSLIKDGRNASTAEQQLIAAEAANQLRKDYGIYNTGTLGENSAYASSNGSKISGLTEDINSYGSFNYENQDAYRKVLDSIVNHQQFSYDPESDPSWSAYQKAYNREGERASANALAQAAAATGGRPSSYAISAAQQAANYYAGQLADMLPTLQQNAYSQYLNNFNNRVTALNALQADKEFNYSDWMNQYNMLQNSLNNYQTQDATDYQRYLNAQAQKQQETTNALELLQTLGYATPEVAEALGLSKNTGAAANTYDYDTHGYTKGQIEEIQRAAGIAVDGIWGPDTQAAYNAGYRPDSGNVGGTVTGNTGSTGVNEYGYDTHGYTTDQIKALQKAAGITEDGIWGPKTQVAYEAGYRPGNGGAVIDASVFTGWTLRDWQDYFAAIRRESETAAVDELRALIDAEAIPTPMIPYASMAVTGEVY